MSYKSNQLNKILVIVGPSGVGKGTLINKLLNEFPNHFTFKISHTTRGLRTGEVNGKNYHFLTKPDFEKVKIFKILNLNPIYIITN